MVLHHNAAVPIRAQRRKLKLRGDHTDRYQFALFGSLDSAKGSPGDAISCFFHCVSPPETRWEYFLRLRSCMFGLWRLKIHRWMRPRQGKFDNGKILHRHGFPRAAL